MPRPCAETVALLSALLDEARAGRVQDVFALFRCADGSYGYECIADDVPDLLYELGTAILTIRIEGQP